MRRASSQSSIKSADKSQSKAAEEDRFNLIKTPLKKVSILFDRIRSHRKVMFNYHRSMKVNHKMSLLMNEVRSWLAWLNNFTFMTR